MLLSNITINLTTLILLLICCNHQLILAAKSNGVAKIDDLRIRYISLEKALWNYLDERKTSDQFGQLRKVYDNHNQFINDDYTLINDYNFDKYFPLNTNYEWNLLEKDLIEINGYFGYYRSFLKKYNGMEYDERAALDFTDSILKDRKFSIHDILDRIENIMVKQTLYYRAMLDGREQLCATNQSAQQFLFSLYSDIALTELKGYTMVQFSYMMLRIYGKGNFTEESRLMRENFEKRTENTQKLLRNVMERADRIVWKCDPAVHIKGETYEEVTRLLQGYIENEVDLNTDGTCRENCGYYQISKNHGCYQDLYCSRQPRCTGKLLNCQYVDSDMWICQSPYNSTRRYDYIEYESGRTLGTKGKCVRGQTKVESWWRWLFWHCSYCFCLCDEQGTKSDRYFNLRQTVSDLQLNMVVTGLRFVKHKRIFHIQIQQGELLPNGNIKLDTINWKPVEDYQIFDRSVKSKIDYHTLAWDNRAIDLDDITADEKTQVVTGIRLRVVGTHLNLEAQFTDYNFESGKLVDPITTSYWKSNDNTDMSGVRRTSISLTNPDIPIRSAVKSLPTSTHNQFIEFTNSDIDRDAAQSTVPFIDIQDVVSNPPVPLTGAGIYHKGRKHYGGFIAPKLITFDFSSYIKSPLDSQ